MIIEYIFCFFIKIRNNHDERFVLSSFANVKHCQVQNNACLILVEFEFRNFLFLVGVVIINMSPPHIVHAFRFSSNKNNSKYQCPVVTSSSDI